MSNNGPINTDGTSWYYNNISEDSDFTTNSTLTSNQITYYPQVAASGAGGSTSNITWTAPITTTGTGGTVGISTGGIGSGGWVLGAGSILTGGYSHGTITLDRFERYGAASYSDLLAGLRPGDAWFQPGTMVKLKNNLFFYGRDGLYLPSMALENSLFVYLGVVEDLVMGKERHWFLSESGQMVQYYQDIGDLGWREGVKGLFKEIE